VIFVFLFIIGIVSALPIYVSPLDSGSLSPSTSFNYTFNFTTGSDCSGVILSNESEIVTNKYGVGFIDLDISGLTSRPSYLCEYRDGVIRKIHNFSDMVLGKVWAEEFVGDGSGITNLNTTGSETSFDGWDKNSSDDFGGDWANLSNRPSGLDDGDDDTTYTNGTSISLIGNVFSLIGSFFSGSWNDLSDVPSGFSDGVDNDTTYSHLSNFSDDLVHTVDTNCSADGSCGLLTYDSELSYYSDSDIGGDEGAFDGWDKNSSDDFGGDWANLSNRPSGLDDGDDDTTYTNGTSISLIGNVFSLIGSFFSGSWNDLSDVPSGFSDGVDNDSQLSESQVDSFVSNNGYLTNYTETDPYWTGNQSSYSTTSVSNTLYAPINYGDNWNKTYADTLYAGTEWDYNQTAPAIAYADATFLTSYTETDPYWTGNQSSYSTTSEIVALGYYNSSDFSIGNYYNSSEVDSEIVSANSSMKGYVDARDSSFNSSVVAWADSKFVSSSGGGNLTGQYDFNGDWTTGGVSIIDGSVYAQTGYFYNISSLEVNNLEVNGSISPDLDGQFDLGSGSYRWNDLYLAGEVMSNGTGDSWFLGNVGIGMGAPEQELHVHATSDARIQVTDDTSGSGTSDGSYWRQLGVDSYLGNQETGDLALFVDNDYSKGIFIQTGGNVGIGTTAPDNKLHVLAGSAGAVTAHSETNLVVENSNHGGIGVLVPDAKTANLFLGSLSDSFGAGLTWTHDTNTMTVGTHNTDGFIRFNVAEGTEAMRIDTSGNVGIGTTAPGAKLDVAGTFNVTSNGGTLQVDSDGNVKIGL